MSARMSAADLAEYAGAVRGFLERVETPQPETAGAAATRALWSRMSGQLGAAGLLVPERLGGEGADVTVAGVVLEELGAARCRVPFLSAGLLAPAALLASGSAERADEYLSAMAKGEVLATVAFADGSELVVGGNGERRTLTGTLRTVLDADLADVLLVVADLDDRQALLAVDAHAPEVTASARPLLDLTRSCADVTLTGASARLLDPDFTVGAQRLLDLAHAGLAAEMAGAARRVTAMSVEYASVRTQFGAPIGSTQAVQRLCVEMYRIAEGAGAIAGAACAALAAADPDASRLASAAKAYTSAHCPRAGEACVQVHGGIGFTWEHSAHLYLRRMRCDAALFGDAIHHRGRLALDLGLARTR